jgi:hypothetical protein
MVLWVLPPTTSDHGNGQKNSPWRDRPVTTISLAKLFWFTLLWTLKPKVLTTWPKARLWLYREWIMTSSWKFSGAVDKGQLLVFERQVSDIQHRCGNLFRGSQWRENNRWLRSQVMRGPSALESLDLTRTNNSSTQEIIKMKLISILV